MIFNHQVVFIESNIIFKFTLSHECYLNEYTIEN